MKWKHMGKQYFEAGLAHATSRGHKITNMPNWSVFEQKEIKTIWCSSAKNLQTQHNFLHISTIEFQILYIFSKTIQAHFKWLESAILNRITPF